ncbi:transketolase [Candidatus Peregrinibacteria bacterium]|nr:transketolase [Candidatus Peregrinibacteria bacterium]
MLEKKAAQIRLLALESVYKAGVGNVGNLMSSVEILTALYYGEIFGRKIMKVDPTKPGWSGQDYLILSKVEAAPLQYAVLADLGFFDKSELAFLGRAGSILKEYPSGKAPGVTGTILSKGYGLSFAVGLVLALKMEKKGNKVFVLLSAEELRQGQVWEAIIAAAYHRLDNLIVFVDDPAVEVDVSQPVKIHVGQVQDKFKVFGWDVAQVIDGHNFDQLLSGLDKSFKTVRKPSCIWCHTIAGKGIEFAERKTGYLNAILSEGEMLEILSKFNVSA